MESRACGASGPAGRNAARIQIEPFLATREAHVRAAAVEALGRIGEGRARVSLKAIAKRDPEKWVRSTAEEAIKKLDEVEGWRRDERKQAGSR